MREAYVPVKLENEAVQKYDTYRREDNEIVLSATDICVLSLLSNSSPAFYLNLDLIIHYDITMTVNRTNIDSL